MRTDIDVLLGQQLNTISETDSRRASDEAAALAEVLAAADEVASAASRVFGMGIHVTPCVARSVAVVSMINVWRRSPATGADVLASDVEFVATLPLGDPTDTKHESLFSLRLWCGKWAALDAVNELHDDAVSAARGAFARPVTAERIARTLLALRDRASRR
jgi:hypothetical protein